MPDIARASSASLSPVPSFPFIPASGPLVTPGTVTSGTVLAFDFGGERIGVAVGETSTGLAHPLTTIGGGTIDARFDAISRLIADWKPSRLLVGLPVHLDGTEHEMTARARRFARRLEGRFGIAVELVDERLTTREAASRLHDAGVGERRQRPVRDRVAAQAILETWLAG